MFMLGGYNMSCRIGTAAVLAALLLVVCLVPTECKGGRGGGGSRGGSGSRGSSGSSRRGGTDYNRRNRPSNPPAPPRSQPPPQPKQTHDVPKSRPAESPSVPASNVRPSAPEAPKPNVVQQPAYNPNFRETNPHVGSANQPGQSPAKLPPYSPQERPPPYAPAGAPPPYSPGGQGAGSYPQPPPGGSYPRQPGAAPYPQQPGGAPPAYPGASYPRQPGGAPPGYPGASYPQQPGGAPPGYPGASYPRQPGAAPYPQQPGSSYPRQPGYPGGGGYPGGAGYPGAAYPRQPGFSYPQSSQTMGANVWQPNAGRPPPSFMGSGGLPTGTNMQSQPYKKKGFLGSIFSMGGSKSHKMKTSKYGGSSLNPYGMAAMGGGVGALGAMGAMKYGKSAGMYAMLPYMAARRSGGLFGGSGFRTPLLMMMLFHRPHFGGYGYGGYGYGYGHHGHRQHYYDVYSDNYVGRCNRPLTPTHGKIHCVSTENQVDCEATCLEGYLFPDNETRKENKCWHVGGVWRPSKNFPACKPVCNETCFNNGTCSGPGLCACPPEYRGQLCEYPREVNVEKAKIWTYMDSLLDRLLLTYRHLDFLKCDMRHMAGNDVTWSCRHGKNETVCSVTCRPPLTFANPDIGQFHCSPNGTWAPDVIPPCVGEVEKTCTEKPDIGPCSAYQYPVWHYDAESGTCKTFVYGGCQGNGNRYSSGEECMKHCKGEDKVPESTASSVK